VEAGGASTCAGSVAASGAEVTAVVRVPQEFVG